MSEPKRLLDHGATELEHQLLAAGARDEPSAKSARRVAAALGFGAAAGLAAKGLQAADGGKSWVLAAKWATAGLLAAGAIILARRVPLATPSAPADTAPAVVSLSSDTPAPAAPPVASVAGPAPSVAPPVARPRGSARSAAAEPLKPRLEARPASLQDEIHALDAIRRAVGAGNQERALSELADYQRDYPHGTLRPEATLLRIEALARSGNRPAAEALARQFLADQPNSPHAKRVESLLHQDEHAARSVTTR